MLAKCSSEYALYFISNCFLDPENWTTFAGFFFAFFFRTSLQDIRNFLNSLPSQQIVRQHCGSEVVDESIIQTIENTVDEHFVCVLQVVFLC